MSAALNEPDDDEVANALRDVGQPDTPSRRIDMRRVLSNFVRLRKIREPAAQSPSQPLVEVQEPGLLQGRSRIGWGEEWGDWEEIPPGEWSIWRHRVENFPDGYEFREWFAATPVRGLPLTKQNIRSIWQTIDTGDIEDDLMSFAEAVIVATGARALLETLTNIANANQREWDEAYRHPAHFKDWAQSRARAAIKAHGIGSPAPGGDGEEPK